MKNRFVIYSLTLLLLPSISFGQQTKQNPVDPAHAARMAKSQNLFKSTVRHALTAHCLKCHGGDKTEGDFNLTTREFFLQGGTSGETVEIGKAKESYLADMLHHRVEPGMPQNSGKLSEALITAILEWADLGAAYDRPLVDREEAEDAWTRRRIDQSQKNYWAFQPLRAVKIRSDLHPAPQNPIDHYVAAAIHRQKLGFSPKAKTHSLVRRIFLDTLGMPPTADELKTLTSLPKDKVLQATISYVLESPHYGERWARHWLDVARFAESHGFEHDYDRPFAFHYRDFVIKALNQDLPYRDFTRWQLAGDEIAPQNPLAMMATGFLGAGVFPTQITANEVEPSRYDALDDMAATTGTAMLAMTIGCARCHDHKFDPIPNADYYRFTSTFTTAVRSNQEILLNQEEYERNQAQFEKEHQPYLDAITEYENTTLRDAFNIWDKANPEKELPEWYTMTFFDVQSEASSVINRQADESFKVEPWSVANQDAFTFEFHTHLPSVKALRIEAFADPALKAGGPGLAANGNFQLTQITIGAAPLKNANNLNDVKFREARATFNQNDGNLHVRTVIDGQQSTGWAVDPQFGKDHAAILTLAEPMEDPSGHRLRITVSFKGNTKHIMGRFRISVSGNPELPLLTNTISENVAKILQKPATERTEEEIKPAIQWYRTSDNKWKELTAKAAAHLKNAPSPQGETVMIVSEGVKPIRHHSQGKDFFEDFYFLKRGDVKQKVGKTSQGFLQVLMPAEDSIERWQQNPPENATSSYRRTTLANWMVDTEAGAGHLLARVIVNRLWHHHFGRGIVSSTNDFGIQGQPPTHPGLLDWLALQLIANDWSLKHLHSLILSSYTYQQSSEYQEENAQADPLNLYLWRFSPRRL
ncbi:MAG: PSD1 and planctomycete cytochrome C domain-containing protein, partial [Planctomycetota bacterium]|nr:PSD1 and planctomycete cytochrome C domain-containing protein [Planctomycetota bacterium]